LTYQFHAFAIEMRKTIPIHVYC